MTNDVLLILDTSYVAYFCLFSALSRWRSQYYDMGLEILTLPEPGSVPYDDLPDLTKDTKYFTKVLSEVAIEKLNVLNNIIMNATGRFYSNAVGKNRIDTVMARDSHGSESFRKKLYPAYKMQRQSEREEQNNFNHWKIMDYMYSVVLPDLLPKNDTYVMKLPGCEGDDIIATLIQTPKLRYRYNQIILISSDHDYLQLHKPENRMKQFTLKGEEVLCQFQRTQGGRRVDIPITADQALLMKIITGDSSDNIPGIKRGLGPVRTWNLICEHARENLKKLFDSDNAAAVTFQLNRKLISFEEIPMELQNEIIADFERKLSIGEYL